MTRHSLRLAVGAVVLLMGAPAIAGPPAPAAVSYGLDCGPDSCLIHSPEISFVVVRNGPQVALLPLTFTPRPRGPLADFGTLATSQFNVVPDNLYPDGGHYLVGPSLEQVIEWKRDGDSISRLTLAQFLDRIRPTKSVHISISHLVSRDAVGGDSRQLRTAPLVSVIERARDRLLKGK